MPYILIIIITTAILVWVVCMIASEGEIKVSTSLAAIAVLIMITITVPVINTCQRDYYRKGQIGALTKKEVLYERVWQSDGSLKWEEKENGPVDLTKQKH